MTTTPDQTRTPPPRQHRDRLPAPGRGPVAAPAAGYVGALIALVVLGAGVVAVRDAAVFAGWLDGQPFTTTAIDGIDGLTVQWWTSPVGIIAIGVGLWWTYAALRPRRPTAVAVAADTSVWIAPADLARIATATANTVPGVLSARSKAGLRKITVTAQITADTSNDGQPLKSAIAAAITNALGPALASPPKIMVRTRTGGQ